MIKEQKLEVLNKAEELINCGWTKGVYARRKDDVMINYKDSSACKFCLDGALLKAVSLFIRPDKDVYVKALKEIRTLVASCISDERAFMGLFKHEDHDKVEEKITLFNDSIYIDKNSVLGVLQLATKKLENE